MRARMILAIAVLFAANGCSTTSHLTQSDITAPPVVQPPAAVNLEVAGYVDRLFAPLASRGFRLGATANPNALRFSVSFDPNIYHIPNRPRYF